MADESRVIDLGINVTQNADAEFGKAATSAQGFADASTGASVSSDALKTSMGGVAAELQAMADQLTASMTFWQDLDAREKANGSTLADLLARSTAWRNTAQEDLKLTADQAAAVNDLDASVDQHIEKSNQEAAAVDAVTNSLKSFNEETGLAMKALPEEAAGIQQNIQLYDSLPTSLDNSSSSSRGLTTEMRGVRYGAMDVVMGLSMLQLALGETNPQLTEAGRGFTVFADSLMAGTMIAPGVGTAFGAIAGAIMAIGIASQTADPDIVALDKDLQSMGKKDDATAGLAKLAGTTQDVATAALAVAKTNPDVADALKADEESAKNAIPVLQGFADDLKQVTQWMGNLAQANGPVTNFLSNATHAFEVNHEANMTYYKDLADGMSQADAWADRQRVVTEGLTQQDIAQKQLAQDTATAAQIQQNIAGAHYTPQAEADYAQQQALQKQIDNLPKAEQTARDGMAAADKTYYEELDRQQAAQVIRDMQRADEATKIQRTYDETRAKDYQTLVDEEGKAAQEFNNKESDLLFTQQQRQETAANDMVRTQQTAFDDIAKAERDMIQSVANLDFTTADKLRNAKTERERDAIDYTAVHEKAVLAQREGNQVSDIQTREANEVALQQFRSQQQDEQANHELDVARRTETQRVDDAKQKYTEQLAAARQANTDQLTDLRARIAQEDVTLADQLAQIQQHHRDAYAAAEKRFSSEESLVLKRFGVESSAEARMMIQYGNDFALQTQMLQALSAFAGNNVTNNTSSITTIESLSIAGGSAPAAQVIALAQQLARQVQQYLDNEAVR